jgi:hypothetical protein
MIAERSARSTVNTPSTRPTDRSAPAGSAQAHEAAPDSTVIGGQQGLKRALNGILIGWDSGEGLDLGAIGRAICLLPSSVGPARLVPASRRWGPPSAQGLRRFLHRNRINLYSPNGIGACEGCYTKTMGNPPQTPLPVR